MIESRADSRQIRLTCDRNDKQYRISGTLEMRQTWLSLSPEPAKTAALCDGLAPRYPAMEDEGSTATLSRTQGLAFSCRPTIPPQRMRGPGICSIAVWCQLCVWTCAGIWGAVIVPKTVRPGSRPKMVRHLHNQWSGPPTNFQMSV